jgi:hypothetical protein
MDHGSSYVVPGAAPGPPIGARRAYGPVSRSNTASGAGPGSGSVVASGVASPGRRTWRAGCGRGAGRRTRGVTGHPPRGA